MVRKANVSRKPHKVALEKASASEIISALGIGRIEERRAQAAVAAAERLIRRGPDSAKKRISGKVVRLRKAAAAED